jgi:iron complex transport system substrate-binding protein
MGLNIMSRPAAVREGESMRLRRFGVCIVGWLAAVCVLVTLAMPAAARVVTDSAGRQVNVPDTVTRVFAAGPPASVLLYSLAPETMVGWVRAPREAEKPFLLERVRALPELGRLTGRGDTLNIEVLVASKPDLVIDFGSLNDTYISLANRVQEQTGIPYILLDGRFESTASALRLLGDILGKRERGEQLAKATEAILADADRVVATVPADKRPRVYLARGREGLETGTRGSINTEIIERVGATNVAEGVMRRGAIANASTEQIIAWAPDTVIAMDQAFRADVRNRPTWAPVPAVAAGRIYLAPSLPFGFVDAPPSLNRLAGVIWLTHVFYPQQARGDLRGKVRDFYALFYQVTPSDAELDAILDQAGAPK